MKKIAVTGGKGGTGKSTVSILLSFEFVKKGKKVVLVDSDVECPNDYLLLGQKLKNIQRKTYTFFPKLNKKKCKKCGLCVKSCRNHAIFQPPGGYPVFIRELCLGCGACIEACPFGAIEKEKVETGKIYLNKIKDLQNLYLLTGAAKPKLEETGPIVRELKDFSLKFAKKIKADSIIFDSAAGTHCPVIQALLGVNLVYAVTEPTPMGANDLSLILELAKKLKLKTEIIINQSNLGDKKIIEKIARKYRTNITREIPYSQEIAKLYSKGQLLKLFFNGK